MNRKIIGFFIVCLFIFAGIFPIVNGYNISNQLDQQQIICDEFGAIPGSEWLVAMSFRPTLTSITKVQLLLKKIGNPTGEYGVAIRDDLAGENLRQTFVQYSNIPDAPTWIEFNFDPLYLTPEETYYILFYIYFEWNNTVSNGYGLNNPYTRGEFWYRDFILGWVTLPQHDFCFKTYGLIQNNEQIEIESISGGFRASSDIKNDGTSTFYDIDWSIDLEGGLILQGGHSDGVIDEIPAGESKTIRLSSLFGIGPTTITVTVGESSKQASGFILGPLVLNVREI